MIMLAPSDFKIRLGRGIKTDAENAAALFRQRLGIPAAGRLEALRAARSLGVRVLFPHQFPSIPSEVIGELENGGAGKWSAVFLPLPAPAGPLIINNRLHSEGRQEANIFHELGHYLCQHEPDGIELIHGFPIRTFSEEKEAQADIVGQALHLPKAALFLAVRRRLTQAEVCSEYCASNELVRYRMNISGVAKIVSRSKR